ncbi:MAG: hypothetical protein ACD_39C01460G0002 [uncultured bacterium]|nr:MAG: hypothetical protein ACD_39C01460G0002 [uncultured bacterium]
MPEFLVNRRIYSKLLLCLSLMMFSSCLHTAPKAELEPQSFAKLTGYIRKVMANYRTDKDFWRKDSYTEGSIARVKMGKLPVQRPFNIDKTGAHPYLVAYQQIDRIIASFKIDPTDPENFKTFLDLHRLCVGTTAEYSLIDRIIYSMLANREKTEDIYQLFLYLKQFNEIYPERLYFPLNKNLLELKILAEAFKQQNNAETALTGFDAGDFPMPITPGDLCTYAQSMLTLGKTDIAREATERFVKQQFWRERSLDYYPELADLYRDVERPLASIPAAPDQYRFARITGGLFGSSRRENNKPVYLTYRNNILEPSGNCYVSKDSAVKVDIVDYAASQAVSAPETDIIPDFYRDKGFYFIFYPAEGNPIALIGEIGVNCELHEFFAVVDGKFRILNNPEAHWAVNLLLQETGIINVNQNGDVGSPDGKNPVAEVFKLANIVEIPVPKFEFPEKFTSTGKMTFTSRFTARLPDTGAVLQIAQFSWRSSNGGYRDPYYSLYFDYKSSRPRASNEQKLLDLDENAAEMLVELERFTGGKLESCSFLNMAADVEDYPNSPENRWLKGWGANSGLPDYQDRQVLLRLYHSSGLDLPAYNVAGLPYSFNGSFDSVRLRGYWFADKKMLVVCDFDTDMNSQPGQIIARTLSLPAVEQKIRVRSLNPFEINNYAIRFESKGDLPPEWAAGIEKVMPKEAAPGNQGRMMCFFVQEKGLPAVFKAVPEPDPDF